MTATVATLTRSFSYLSMELPDPGPDLTPDEVRDVYSASYPELATAEVSGPEQKGDKLVWAFQRAIGTKGATGLTPSPRFHLRERTDGLSYVEPLPAAAPTWGDRIARACRTLGQKIDRALFATDLTAVGRRAR